MASEEYSRLKSFLSSDVTKTVENRRMLVVPASGRTDEEGKTNLLLDEISRIERAWGLV